MNAFFLKYVLWLPPLNPLNTYRLTLLFLLALPATKVCSVASTRCPLLQGQHGLTFSVCKLRSHCTPRSSSMACQGVRYELLAAAGGLPGHATQ